MTTALPPFASLLPGSRADYEDQDWDEDVSWDEMPPLPHGMISVNEPDDPPALPVIWLPSTDGYRKHTLHPPRRPFGFRSR